MKVSVLKCAGVGRAAVCGAGGAGRRTSWRRSSAVRRALCEDRSSVRLLCPVLTCDILSVRPCSLLVLSVCACDYWRMWPLAGPHPHEHSQPGPRTTLVSRHFTDDKDKYWDPSKMTYYGSFTLDHHLLYNVHLLNIMSTMNAERSFPRER